MPRAGSRLSEEMPTADTFYWIATESRRARAMRPFLADELAVAKECNHATGCWKRDDNDRE
jgi:NADPH-dependent ferric siderophore reductase